MSMQVYVLKTCSGDIRCSIDMGVLHGPSARKRSKDMQDGEVTWIQLGHVRVALKCSLKMQQGHAAWIYRMEKQQGHTAWTFSMDMQHEHASGTSSMDMRHKHAA
jgi:hypothetical protein